MYEISFQYADNVRLIVATSGDEEEAIDEAIRIAESFTTNPPPESMTVEWDATPVAKAYNNSLAAKVR